MSTSCAGLVEIPVSGATARWPSECCIQGARSTCLTSGRCAHCSQHWRRQIGVPRDPQSLHRAQAPTFPPPDCRSWLVAWEHFPPEISAPTRAATVAGACSMQLASLSSPAQIPTRVSRSKSKSSLSSSPPCRRPSLASVSSWRVPLASGSVRGRAERAVAGRGSAGGSASSKPSRELGAACRPPLLWRLQRAIAQRDGCCCCCCWCRRRRLWRKTWGLVDDRETRQAGLYSAWVRCVRGRGRWRWRWRCVCVCRRVLGGVSVSIHRHGASIRRGGSGVVGGGTRTWFARRHRKIRSDG